MDRAEWLRWRHQGIGSSDAPVIMGASPWKTPLQLYEEKILPDPIAEESSFIQQRGIDIEPKIRSVHEINMGMSYAPRLVVMEGYPYIRASLDGATDDLSHICEIKLSGAEDWHASRAADKVPEKYVHQIQHQLMVSGAKSCFYLSYLYEKGQKEFNPSNVWAIEVHPAPETQGRLLEQESWFWKMVTERTPPAPSDRDFKTLKGMTAVANRWKRANLKLDQIKDELGSARAALIDAANKAGHPRCIAGGVKLTQVMRNGSIDSGKIILAMEQAIRKYQPCFELDQEQFRKKPSVSWRVGEE